MSLRDVRNRTRLDSPVTSPLPVPAIRADVRSRLELAENQLYAENALTVRWLLDHQRAVGRVDGFNLRDAIWSITIIRGVFAEDGEVAAIEAGHESLVHITDAEILIIARGNQPGRSGGES